jgi:cytochrome c oxidase assembly protein subunit 15
MRVVARRTGLENDYEKNNRLVANWLLAGVIMTIIQVLLGGITRLTGSGLSITEWDVVTGSLPPLSAAGWLVEFDKYKSTPQFQLLNSDFSLSDFKFIFFWEWFHRLWARLIGLVFATGFIYFAVTRKFQKEYIRPLVILFLLGGLQGFVGWIMVASGLEGDAVYVKPTRLALHFIFALGLLSYTFWFFLMMRVPLRERTSNVKIARMVLIMLVLLVVQLMYGALMAGHKAASAAATWPDINGYLISPPGLYNSDHGIMNLIDNKIMVHFVHRGLAYVLLVFGIAISYALYKLPKKSPTLTKTWYFPAILLLLQVILGILSVLTSTGIVPNQWGTFEWMAQLHQLTGMLLLLSFVFLLYLTISGKKSALKSV